MSDTPEISRDQSLDAKPVAMNILKREPLGGGGERITVPYQPTGWIKAILRVPDTATKQYELDAIGVEVLGYCDGERSVRKISKLFAKKHQLDDQEAERAVVAFLEMLVKRGVVAIVVPKK